MRPFPTAAIQPYLDSHKIAGVIGIIADRDGNTPLLAAAARNHLKVCRQLLKAGADPHPRNQAGLNAADYA